MFLLFLLTTFLDTIYNDGKIERHGVRKRQDNGTGTETENCRVDEVNFREKDKIRQEAVKIVLELP